MTAEIARNGTNDNHQSEPKDLHLCRGGEPYGDLCRTSPQSGEASTVRLFCQRRREPWKSSRTLVFHAMGLDGSDDAVPALRPLTSRAHCFIGGSFSARADYLVLLLLRGTAPTEEGL